MVLMITLTGAMSWHECRRTCSVSVCKPQKNVFGFQFEFLSLQGTAILVHSLQIKTRNSACNVHDVANKAARHTMAGLMAVFLLL